MVPIFSIPSIPSTADDFSISPVRYLTTIIGGGAAPTVDPFWANVSFMMGFDNTTGPTSALFIDESQYNWNPINAAGQGTNWFNDPNNPVFIGTGSGMFVAGGGRPTIGTGLPVPLQFGLGDFTIEMFAYPTTLQTFSNPLGNITSDTGSWTFTQANGRWTFAAQNGVNLSASFTSPLSTWTNLAVSRNGGTIRMFINGVMVDKNTNVAALSVQGVNPISIAGSYFGSIQWYAGKLDEIRITKGVGRYNSDTSFTVASAKFPRISA